MARDYKNTRAPRRKTATRKTTRKKTTRKKATRKSANKTSLSLDKLPTWAWFIAGILVAITIMWIKANWFTKAVVVPPMDMTPLSSRLEEESPKASVQTEAKNEATDSYELKKDPRFTFYERLPKDEIIISQEALDVEVDKNKNNDAVESIKSIQKAGSYVVQAGSFQKFADADRRKAELALLGLESKIQQVSIDEKNWYRVRIGPYSDLELLNNTRQRLRDGAIDVLVIRTQ